MMKNYYFILVLLFLVAFDISMGIDESSTTGSPCPFAAGNAGIFIASGVDFAEQLYGKVDPIGTCLSCNAGANTFYASASNPVPHQTLPHEAIGTLNFEICESMCVCDVNGKCYTRYNRDALLTLWPYCNAGVCGVYGVLNGDSDNDGLVAVGETTPSFTAGAQIDVDGTVGDKYSPFPVTYSCYPQIVSVSCNGCPITTCTN